MKSTASKLREDVYNILDRVIDTGLPVEVVRKGRVLEIVPKRAPSKPSRRRPRPRAMVGDPEEFVHLDWLREWKEWK